MEEAGHHIGDICINCPKFSITKSAGFKGEAQCWEYYKGVPYGETRELMLYRCTPAGPKKLTEIGEAMKIPDEAYTFEAVSAVMSALKETTELCAKLEATQRELEELKRRTDPEYVTPPDSDLYQWADVVEALFRALRTEPDRGMFADNMTRAIAMAEAIPRAVRWIPAEDKRQPKENKPVLAWIERDKWGDGDEPGRVQEWAIGYKHEGRWFFNGYPPETTKCLAWMKLPKPYKGT